MSTPNSDTVTSSYRKARKRELDRISQQRKRKKDRDHVARLQARLDDLQQDADKKHVGDLLLERDRNQAQIERHQDRMRKIQAILVADMQDMDLQSGMES
jgi:hypothetical protein